MCHWMHFLDLQHLYVFWTVCYLRLSMNILHYPRSNTWKEFLTMPFSCVSGVNMCRSRSKMPLPLGAHLSGQRVHISLVYNHRTGMVGSQIQQK